MSFSGKSNATSQTVVTNDGWWPDIAVADFQELYRMPREYAEIMLVDGLVLGMSWANSRLAEWKARQFLAGNENAEAVSGNILNGESEYVVHYRRAVMSYAKSYLLQQYPTINRREAAGKDALESEDTEDKFLEYAQQAIADLQARPRVTAELI